MNGKVDFYRDWKEYQNGFGYLTEEHWIGLRNWWFSSALILYAYLTVKGSV